MQNPASNNRQKNRSSALKQRKAAIKMTLAKGTLNQKLLNFKLTSQAVKSAIKSWLSSITM
jgi:hypothetical protein